MSKLPVGDERTTSAPTAPEGRAEEGGTRRGLTITRRFTRKGYHPFDEVEWELRTATITNEKGEVVFEQKGVEFPKFWSQMATNVVASKYFRGPLGSPERERSVRQLIGRVVRKIREWGEQGGYFATPDDAEAFADELTYVLLHQQAAFNSPVWFNLGVPGVKQQVSACFINSVEDTMESILELAKTEGMLFKGGSGTGTNFSTLRSSKEPLAGGGTASGPVSFMRGYDAFAGVIKSGGKTRRAAKMVILNADHPDIVEFIRCKMDEERKAWALIDAGYEGGFNVAGGAYDSIQFQNANHSVRVTDEFMLAAIEDKEWVTRAVTTGEPMERHRARDLLRLIAESTWVCGDPGMQFDTTINDWHTCINTDRIHASNPCSEYMHLNDSACNLASLNLMRFVDEEGEFDVEAFKHAVAMVILAQEILVGFADYPTPKIARNAHDYRQLGLGYANLGALLMARGLPYDSDAGRHYAAAITALMSGHAYWMSAKVAEALGPFAGYEKNREPMLRVMEKHRSHLARINPAHVPLDLLGAAREAWNGALELGRRVGYRNSQISVIAPTGTIAFMMDCDTTGIEPDIALVKYKKLVGGGVLKIVNTTVPVALRRLGYDDPQIKAIVEYIDENGTIEGAPGLEPKDLPVFDCAFRPVNGTRSIHYLGHLKMMAAVQPFISGAISKTINVPAEATVDDIMEAYIEAWRLGLKAVAIYRDGSKRSQPLSTAKDREKKAEEAPRPVRRKLPDERAAITHKFSIAGHEGYITVGMYEDGSPGEIFIVMAKEGSVVSGLMDSFATAISLALQYGVPLKVLVDKFSHTRFEPAGFTTNPQIPMAKSIMDYIFRWLASKFLSKAEQEAVGVIEREAPQTSVAPGVEPGGRSTTALPAGRPAAGQPAPSSAATPAAAAGTSAASQAPSRPGAAAASPAAPAVPKAKVLELRAKELGTGEKYTFQVHDDAPSCSDCGSLMVRNGACYKCLNCGSTSGCS